MFRIGMGYDVHKLVEGRKLVLGGIEIPHTVGLLGHSDADVLIHAICDALLGAANMRDIGYHFPDTSASTLGMDSKVILAKVIDLIATKGYKVGNIDATVCAERPKINPHVPAMKACLAHVMGCDEDQVSIKATTTERLGFTGREEGISAYAVALITDEGPAPRRRLHACASVLGHANPQHYIYEKATKISFDIHNNMARLFSRYQNISLTPQLNKKTGGDKKKNGKKFGRAMKNA